MNGQQAVTLLGFAMLTACLAWGIVQIRNEVKTQVEGVTAEIHNLPTGARAALGF